MSTLDQEEQDLLASVESGEWQSISNASEAMQRYQGYAQQQLNLWAEVNNELSEQDWKRLESLAQGMKTSVPQLMVNIIHQYLARQFAP
jgi:predicted DNA binding CopG/RHH family protein